MILTKDVSCDTFYLHDILRFPAKKNQKLKSRNLLSDFKLVAKLWAEFIGSTFLVMAAISPVILFNRVLDSGIGIAVLADAVGVAWVLFALISVFGPVSGAHFNPAVSLSFSYSGSLPWKILPYYVFVQIAGGIVGTLATHLMFYHQVDSLVTLSSVTRNGGCFPAEAFGTFILVFTIQALVYQKSDKLPMVVSLLVGGQLISTSSTMFANPQVTIARMLTYSAAGIRPVDGLIFIVVQFSSAIVATITWQYIFEKNKIPTPDE